MDLLLKLAGTHTSFYTKKGVIENMDFPEREQKVKTAQRLLNLKEDAIAGTATWSAIRTFMGISSQYSAISSIIRQTQKLLGLVEDGRDGPATWNKILEILGAEKAQEVASSSSGKYKETVKLSPQTNGVYSQKIIPKAIIVHSTEGAYLGSIDWTSKIINPKTGKRLYASYHCIIARDGRRTVTNLDDNRAFHAGASSFKGRSSLNGWSIGVAWERNTYNEPLQDAAIESAIEYIVPIMKKWNIPIEMVTDHRTIATPKGRKSDIKPSELERFLIRLRQALDNS